MSLYTNPSVSILPSICLSFYQSTYRSVEIPSPMKLSNLHPPSNGSHTDEGFTRRRTYGTHTVLEAQVVLVIQKLLIQRVDEAPGRAFLTILSTGRGGGQPQATKKAVCWMSRVGVEPTLTLWRWLEE